MRIVSAFALAALCAVVSSAPAHAAVVTVKGEVVDIACATTKGAAGKNDGHSACALTCARNGDPVGVLTDDTIYEVTGDFTANRNAKLLDFVAKSVTITGEVTERDGKKLLNIKTIRVTSKS
jgi:predicted lipoprotein with Yx(FWY)xxD motif